MTNLAHDLRQLGERLERAAARDLVRHRSARRRRLLAVALAVAVAVPGIALAASALISTDEVAAGLPAGTHMLQGTDPRCTVVHAGVEYHCVLSRLPAHPEVADMKGTVEPTVDAARHVNGGCRSLRSDGREWQCYIGRAAVDERIVSADFLGEYMPEPGRG
jgi:hypothetical protein